MREVKVGDNIYLRQYGRLIRIETVISLPRTMIRSENYNYDYPTNDSNFLNIKGRDRWQTVYAYLETEELKKEWHEQRLKQWIANNHQNIPIDLIEKIKNEMEKKL